MNIKVLTQDEAKRKLVGITMTSRKEEYEDKQKKAATNIDNYIKSHKSKKNKSKISRKINKILNSKTINRRVVRPSQTPTIILNQPVYTEDRSRFFKENWEEEKKELYFK